MAIEDFQSGYKLLGLALKHVQQNAGNDLTIGEKAYITELWAVTEFVRYQSEHAREIYDILSRENEPRNRFFNFSSDGEVTEVSREQYNGVVVEEDENVSEEK